MSLPTNVFHDQIYELYNSVPEYSRARIAGAVMRMDGFKFSHDQIDMAFGAIDQDMTPDGTSADLAAIGKAAVLIRWASNANMSHLLSGSNSPLPAECEGYKAVMEVAEEGVSLSITTLAHRLITLTAPLPIQFGKFAIN